MSQNHALPLHESLDHLQLAIPLIRYASWQDLKVTGQTLSGFDAANTTKR
jgi:hypothetical protein